MEEGLLNLVIRKGRGKLQFNGGRMRVEHQFFSV